MDEYHLLGCDTMWLVKLQHFGRTYWQAGKKQKATAA
jgi:hypothetical protein